MQKEEIVKEVFVNSFDQLSQNILKYGNNIADITDLKNLIPEKLQEYTSSTQAYTYRNRMVYIIYLNEIDAQCPTMIAVGAIDGRLTDRYVTVEDGFVCVIDPFKNNHTGYIHTTLYRKLICKTLSKRAIERAFRHSCMFKFATVTTF